MEHEPYGYDPYESDSRAPRDEQSARDSWPTGTPVGNNPPHLWPGGPAYRGGLAPRRAGPARRWLTRRAIPFYTALAALVVVSLIAIAAPMATFVAAKHGRHKPTPTPGTTATAGTTPISSSTPTAGTTPTTGPTAAPTAVATATATTAATATPTTAATATATTGATATATAVTGGLPAYDHVVVIIMENHAFGEIVGNTSAAPYINGTLLPQGALATHYYAVTHPSLPNYLALTGGSSFGITSDCSPSSCPVNAGSLADSLEHAGKTWKAYMESMPNACDSSDAYPYVVKHNPWVYYNDLGGNSSRCAAHDVPATQLATDLQSASTTPSFVWITPNMTDDMHDGSISQGDSWLSREIPMILNSPAFTQQHSLLLLTWDEDDSSASNQVATIAVGYHVKVGGSSSVNYTHYSLLKTIEAAWNLLSLTSNDGGAAPMTGLLT